MRWLTISLKLTLMVCVEVNVVMLADVYCERPLMGTPQRNAWAMHHMGHMISVQLYL